MKITSIYSLRPGARWHVPYQWIKAMLALAAVTGFGSHLEGQTVPVCMDTGDARSLPDVRQAQVIAAGMFERIGVTLEWHARDHACPTQGSILVDLVTGVPGDNARNPLAWSMPFERVHIRVFYDRVRASTRHPDVRLVLAHVLAHEIAHMLERSDMHARKGVMKACWDLKDYQQMERHPLSFTDTDLFMIRAGLKEREPTTLLSVLQPGSSLPVPQVEADVNRTAVDHGSEVPMP